MSKLMNTYPLKNQTVRMRRSNVILSNIILVKLRKTMLRSGIKYNFNFSMPPSKRGGRADDDGDDDYNNDGNNNGCYYYYGCM